ncbi:unnamed protein product [Didymodactylos carnosus]|uniref:CCHC-type domain-containing protein n=1 Tax=Didymodactylos carnosus TaxID=1234261 RepID=A0A813TZR6_9BILA|nr:unnamed protein product [Didymodactylos carnosus]CAF3607404.1 unnamed protein product [Didymodactylos carnosus]
MEEETPNRKRGRSQFSEGQRQQTQQATTPKKEFKIAPVIVKGIPNVNKILLNKILKNKTAYTKIENIFKNKHNLFIIQPSDTKTYNQLLIAFPTNLVPSEKHGIQVYAPSNIKSVLDTEKVAFIKHVDQDFSVDKIKHALTINGFKFDNAERIYVRKDNKPTKTIKVIFVDKLNCETFLKTGLKIDYLHYDAEPAKPNTQPVQCYKCCKFGHPAKYCKNVEICNKCSSPHAANICTSTDVKCINCGEQHMQHQNSVKNI